MAKLVADRHLNGVPRLCLPRRVRPRRDQAAALQRLFQILSLLAGGGSDGVPRSTLETEVDLGAVHT